MRFYSNAYRWGASSISGPSQSFCQYDLAARTISASASSYPEVGASAATGVTAECTVTGISSGTPVNLTVNLQGSVSGYSQPYDYQWGSGGLTLKEDGTSNAASISAPPSQPANLSVALHEIAGVPFRIYLQCGASSNGYGGGASGTLSFTGLPSGASVDICLGPDQPLPVPAHRASWGELKTLYR
jgi:hypothetical protein